MLTFLLDGAEYKEISFKHFDQLLNSNTHIISSPQSEFTFLLQKKKYVKFKSHHSNFTYKIQPNMTITVKTQKNRLGHSMHYLHPVFFNVSHLADVTD